jgi:zinc protease
VRGTCLVVMPAGGKWKEALADAQAELRRFAAEGPTSTEVADAVSTIEAEVYAAWTEIRATPDLAGEIVEAEVGGRIFQSPEDRAASLELAVAGIDEKDVKDAFAHDWSGSGPLLTATGPDTLDKSALLAAWQDNEKAPGLEAYADREEIEWPYARFGKKGKLAAREVVPEGDFVRLRYRNGIVVNYKHTGFEAGAFDMRVSFGHGVRGLAAQDRQAAVLAAGLLPAGGLGKLDHEEITHALGTSTWAFEASPGSNAWQIATAGGVDALDQQMMVVSAFLSDPGFRPLIDEKIPTAFDWSYRAVRAEPAIVALDAMEQALFPEQKSFPPREQVVNLRAADLARLLKPALTGAPIEVAIVGDVDEKTVRRLVARTFGALPPRGPLAPPAGPAPFRRFPEILPAALTGYHEGPPEKAAALLVWPLWVAHRERRAEEHAITLATAIFRNRLLQQVRVATGKVYSPTVNASMPDNSDQGYLAAALDGSATDIGELTTAALAVAAELAAGKITQEEVDAARQPIVATPLRRSPATPPGPPPSALRSAIPPRRPTSSATRTRSRQ